MTKDIVKCKTGVEEEEEEKCWKKRRKANEGAVGRTTAFGTAIYPDIPRSVSASVSEQSC